MQIYVSNLSHQAMGTDLKKLFSAFGVVVSAQVVIDKYTHRSRGCAYVEMEDRSCGEKAINALHNSSFLQKIILVNEAVGKFAQQSKSPLSK